ncbi:MAG: beta-ketoacyl-[acyl-carrier-protein] synthase family protein [Marinilabiliaceae bacterium]|nr:beta-ketoacyl-[acyl-carrier-protein] synthase family protein [Marinilabiliaceae bacterium]
MTLLTNNTNRVFITGFGIISSIGCGESDTFKILQEKRTTFRKVTFLETALTQFPVAEVNKSNHDLTLLASLSDNEHYSRTFLLGIIAAQQAMQMAGLKTLEGIVAATTVGGIDLFERSYKKLIDSNYSAQNKQQIAFSLDISDCTEKIADYFGIRSNVSTISTACSSSANSLITGARMIRSGLVNKILAGGMDALSLFSLNGFNSLEILSDTGCRPFDQQRNGITIGEGAAFLVLESEKSAKNKKIYGEIVGYANRNETFHQTAPSPNGDGIAMTMKQALKIAEINPESIDYINAHGTGTLMNDLSEGNAIKTVFKENIPPISSTKGFTGHTLAAAGAIEAVLCLLSLKKQKLLPNLNLENVTQELSFNPVTEMKDAKINYILSNSIGFGGANSSLIIKKV